MIADDNGTPALELPRIADQRHFDVEDSSQKKSQAAGQPADNFPAIRYSQHTDPKMYEKNEGEEECPKRSNRRKFSPSHDSPLYVWDRDDQSWMLRAGRYIDSNTLSKASIHNDYSAHMHYNDSVLVPARAFNRTSLASSSPLKIESFIALA